MTYAVTAYCLAIGALVKNAGEENRALVALEAVQEYANRNNVD